MSSKRAPRRRKCSFRRTSSTIPRRSRNSKRRRTRLSGALGRLLAITENYPDLKSNQNFLALQSQLEGTENRIAIARQDYITAVAEIQYGDQDDPRPLVARGTLS